MGLSVGKEGSGGGGGVGTFVSPSAVHLARALHRHSEADPLQKAVWAAPPLPGRPKHLCQAAAPYAVGPCRPGGMAQPSRGPPVSPNGRPALCLWCLGWRRWNFTGTAPLRLPSGCLRVISTKVCPACRAGGGGGHSSSRVPSCAPRPAAGLRLPDGGGARGGHRRSGAGGGLAGWRRPGGAVRPHGAGPAAATPAGRPPERTPTERTARWRIFLDPSTPSETRRPGGRQWGAHPNVPRLPSPQRNIERNRPALSPHCARVDARELDYPGPPHTPSQPPSPPPPAPPLRHTASLLAGV